MDNASIGIFVILIFLGLGACAALVVLLLEILEDLF